MRNTQLTMCAALTAVAGILGLAESASAQNVVSVEETWAFKVGEPDTARSSPQVSSMMGPFNTTNGLHFVFTLNHVNSPSFTPGGMQVQVWNGETLQSYRTGPNQGLLNESQDTIRWTQKMSVSNNTLTFEVTSGTSKAWGNFGGQGFLKTSIPNVENLNSYRPYLSLTESGVGYGGNRVSRAGCHPHGSWAAWT